MPNRFLATRSHIPLTPDLFDAARLSEQRQDDTRIHFVDDEADSDANADRAKPPLVILLVDDDQDVHDSTRIALNGERIQGRSIEFLHAYSAEQASRIIAENKPLSMILLDVVMETQDAGLRLLDTMRSEIDRRNIRVIIRTGQPGYLSETQLAGNKLVDGFLLKSKLTRSILLDAVTAALAPRDSNGAVPS